jgi:hypothetical protein
MANTQSTSLALLEASPPGVADRQAVGAAHLVTLGNAEFDAVTVADTLQICRVPVDSVLVSIQMAFDDLGGTETIDVGFYKVGSPGAAVDVDAIIDGLSVASAVALAEYRYHTLDIDTTGKRMWELAGLASRPDYEEIDIVLTSATTTTPIDATVAWIIVYTR